MPVHLYVDRCELDRVIGWIDDDGAVPSIEIELNGQVCAVSPHTHRPDVEAAGFGDGRRGFAVSLTGHLRFARLNANRIAIKRDGTLLYEGPVGNSMALFETVIARLEQAETRLEQAETH